jgi:NAD(P)-dependent dehydrogenase (short-subunit alcohol dehydrogenase family)
VHSQVTYVKRKAFPYCAAKSGLNMFTKTLAVEMIRHNINVNCIAPGFIMTKLSDRYSEDHLRAFKRKIPAGFLGTVDDVTPLVLFLADDAKSRFIVGQTLFVDGGQAIDGALDIMLES